MEFVKAYNGLRGFAFFNVLIDHYLYINKVVDIGQFGVDIFYVLSSYLLTLQLYTSFQEKKHLNIINYFIRRIFRIYPVLTLALLIEYLTNRIPWFSIKGVFTLTGVCGFYWAIYVEMRYYLIVPIVVYIFGKIEKMKNKLILMMVLTFIFSLYHLYLNFIVDDPKAFRRWDINDYSIEKNIIFINYIPIFGLGSFMAIIVYHLKKAGHNFSKCSFLKGLICFILLTLHLPALYYRYKFGYLSFWDLPMSNLALVFSFGYIIVIMFLNGNNFMTRLLEHKFIYTIGEISYPAYLFHTIVREFMFKYYGWEKKFQDLFCCLIITLIISYIIHHTVEKFFINITKYWFYCSNKSANTDKNKFKNDMETKNSKNFYIEVSETEIINNIDEDKVST